MLQLHSSNLHKLAKWVKSVKALNVRDLPIYANYALFFEGSEITTGMMNDRIRLSINLNVGRLYLYNSDTLEGHSIDITSDEIKLAKKMLEEIQLPIPDMELEPISREELIQFRQFAKSSHEILETIKFKLPIKHSQVYLWGHNFDFDLVVYFEDDRQIDIGVSPGDAQHPEPYLYITPRPFNKEKAIEKLEYGRWQFEPWQGIIGNWSDFAKLDLEEAVDRILCLYHVAEEVL